MIGIILTGHGHFAPGVAHALEMIAGEQPAFEVVAFNEEEPIELLETNMHNAVNSLLETTNGIVIFADLLGGSPFKAAMIAAAGKDNVEVICGANLPMLIEISMARTFVDRTIEVVNQAITAGQASIQHAIFPVNQAEDIEEEDGI